MMNETGSKEATVKSQDRDYASEIATTIHQQIGGRAFFMMGAKNIMAGENGSLSWKVGRGASGKGGKVTHVRVELDQATDTYKVETIRVNMRAKEMVKTLETEELIYFDGLHASITRLTGFALSL